MDLGECDYRFFFGCTIATNGPVQLNQVNLLYEKLVSEGTEIIFSDGLWLCTEYYRRILCRRFSIHAHISKQISRQITRSKKWIRSTVVTYSNSLQCMFCAYENGTVWTISKGKKMGSYLFGCNGCSVITFILPSLNRSVRMVWANVYLFDITD